MILDTEWDIGHSNCKRSMQSICISTKLELKLFW